MNPALGFSTIGATNGSYQGAGDWFGINERRMEIANRVTGNETPEELMAIHQEDKALALKAAQAKLKYEYSEAWSKQLEEMAKKERAHRQRMIDAGMLYG